MSSCRIEAYAVTGWRKVLVCMLIAAAALLYAVNGLWPFFVRA